MVEFLGANSSIKLSSTQKFHSGQRITKWWSQMEVKFTCIPISMGLQTSLSET